MQQEKQQASTFYAILSADQQDLPVPSAAATSSPPLLVSLTISNPLQRSQGQAT